MGKTLVQRLDALKTEYAKSKKDHQPSNYLAREMSYLMVKLIRRELRMEKREARDAHS